jgi:alkylation response protein AidB-like acyl-CoA dehydrogenase
MDSKTAAQSRPTLQTLPGDDVRQIMWRFSDRFDIQMLVQSTRSVARGIVAKLVAQGARNTHEWTPEKNELLAAYDAAGITTAFMDPHQGGFIEGPKNLVLSLICYELAWVDAGAATGSLAGNLALSPIHERGTKEQRDHYMSKCVPPQPGEDRQIWRGAFALTEPLPYVGVETGLLCGKVKIAEWKEGQEPMLHIDKRARFITNMGFANFATVAVDSADPRIKTSCMVIIENTDPGIFDRGAPTHKMVHQLSSTNDPVFNVTVPASRIIGGYTVKDGVIIPKYSHGEIIEAVFRRTRVPVGVMTSTKLLSAVEPVIRYQRTRFRGAASVNPGTPRFDLGLQQKEDCLQRLADIWATGEAGIALGMATARLFDELDPLEKIKDAKFAEQGIVTGMQQMKAFRALTKPALEFVELAAKPEGERDAIRFEALKADPLVQYLVLDAQANVLCPATKLWNTGYGATMMREAVALMGGYGITEDCPGFLGHKWMDAQLEATYEGPEAVQRRQISMTMTSEVFLACYRTWIKELRAIAASHPEIGATTIANGMELWLATLEHTQTAKDATGAKLFSGNRHGVVFPLCDALCFLLASRQQILDVLELEAKGPQSATVAEGLAGYVNFFSDLAAVQAATAAGQAARICAELVYGFAAQSTTIETFAQLRVQVDAGLAGSRLAKDRAADALAQVMIPEALDYPA